MILNKEELFTLTNIRNINKSIKFIISINPNINLIVSNGGNKTYAYEYSKLISIKPPKVKIINENGAGDVMAGNYIYYRSNELYIRKIFVARHGNWELCMLKVKRMQKFKF